MLSRHLHGHGQQCIDHWCASKRQVSCHLLTGQDFSLGLGLPYWLEHCNCLRVIMMMLVSAFGDCKMCVPTIQLRVMIMYHVWILRSCWLCWAKCSNCCTSAWPEPQVLQTQLPTCSLVLATLNAPCKYHKQYNFDWTDTQESCACSTIQLVLWSACGNRPAHCRFSKPCTPHTTLIHCHCQAYML